jgi:DNA-binding NtrC family response regulator
VNERHRDSRSVVLVDDEEDVLFSSSVMLETHGICPVITLSDGRDLLPYLQENGVGVIVLDLSMPHVSGADLLSEVVQRHPEIPVVVMTATQEVETAVACMKGGAFDYLVKPVEENRYLSCVRRALELCSLRQQVGALRRSLLEQRLQNDEAFASIITNSPRMQSIFRYVEAVCASREPILITGETGVGKGLIAKAVHRLSGLAGEFVSVNVAGLDDALFSDTLFGHKKGAFTGAERDRDGMVAKAAGGNLFLDEIGDLSIASQVKLLRLLQEQTYMPLGSDVAKKSDAHIVAATNQDLRRITAEGSFRQDLFFRLSAHRVEVPPLRERLEDIPLLVAHFIDQAARSLGKDAPEPTPELLALLSVYHFPGNVRELRAMIFDAVALHRSGPYLSKESCREAMEQNRRFGEGAQTEQKQSIGTSLHTMGRFPTLKEAEKLLIDEALRQARGNQGIAAMLLGISRPALNRRLMRLRAMQKEGD